MREVGWRLLLGSLLAWGTVLAGQNPPAQGPPPGPPVLERATPPAAEAAAPAPAATQPYTISHYDLNLSFDFPNHQLRVMAKVLVTAQQPISGISFRLNQNLVVRSVSDASGAGLPPARQGEQVLVTLPQPLQPGENTTLLFDYGGTLANAGFSPISGIRTAYVGPDGAFLLYPGEWFPMGAYGTDRFTADITATLPAAMQLVASGTGTPTPNPDGSVSWAFHQDQPSFPGSVIATPLKPVTFHDSGVETAFYFGNDVPAALTAKYAAAAADTYSFLDNHFGNAPLHNLTFVELPDDALPSFSSPGLIVLSHANIGSDVNPNLMMDEMAQQWFGVETSPRTLNDAWLQYGAARFCESIYIEDKLGKAAWQDLVEQLEIGALTYPDTALANSASLYPFSPQFQDLNYDKGAMLFHMLRWVLGGDQKLDDGMKAYLTAYAWHSATTGDFEKTLEQASNTDLRSFFAEWYHGNAVPQFTPSYKTYRLGAGGFMVEGTVKQNLDLFTMPVEVRVQTEGGTEVHTVPVSGDRGEFSVQIKARPLKVEVDPNNWILKTDPTMVLKVDLARGDNLVAAGDFAGALRQYNDALQQNPISSLTHYRMAEAYFQEQNWQNAADQYRQAINGDLDPKWVEVWSHIQLGKIFDVSGQRDRAVSEYLQAQSTHDDTMGAQGTVRQLLSTPYKGTNGKE